MSWWAAVAGGLQFASGYQAQQQARKAARESSKLIRFETTEQLRRMDRAQMFRMGEAVSQYAGAGLSLEGTTARVLMDMESEYYKQRLYTKRVGEQRAKAARQGASYVGVPQMVQGASNILAGASAPNPRFQGDSMSSPGRSEVVGNR